ncbi:hypothetical protein M405DRAFT_877455 [Rhizopogon salebrosus TDB-379]|nr:hypothetical protein M405DRAFT_877455 [Rhizopogon salebrosus TDB-379]
MYRQTVLYACSDGSCNCRYWGLVTASLVGRHSMRSGVIGKQQTNCKTVNGSNIRQAYTAFVAAQTKRHHAAEAQAQAGRVCVSDCDPYTGGTDSTTDRTIYLTGYMRSASHVLPQLLPEHSAGRDSTYFVRDHAFNYSILSNEPSTGVRARPSEE